MIAPKRRLAIAMLEDILGPEADEVGVRSVSFFFKKAK